MIICSFFIFYYFFNFLLNFDKNLQINNSNSKIFDILGVIISIIFSAAMFAGTEKMINFSNKIVSTLLFFIVLFMCFIVFKNGIGFISKFNFVLIPFLIVCLIVFEIPFLISGGGIFIIKQFNVSSIVYLIFYCGLNISNSSAVLISLGKGLSKREKAQVSFFAALVLFLLLLATNIVLLFASKTLSADMPLINLFFGNKRTIINMLVLIGSLTSLFSLIFSCSSLVRGLCKNDFIVFVISVICPVFLSFVGFSVIINYLYPIASILSIFLLLRLCFQK